MRDFDVPELQAFLQDKNFKFDIEPLRAQIEAAQERPAQMGGGEEGRARNRGGEEERGNG